MRDFDDGDSPTVAIVCGTLSLMVLLAFVLIIWILWSKQRCGHVAWPWQRQRQARVQDAEAGGSSSGGSEAGSTAGAAKTTAGCSQHASGARMISVVVLHPGNQLDLGTTDTPTAESAHAAVAAAAAAGADGDAPIGLIVSASQQLVAPLPPSPGSVAAAASRAAEAARAAYLAELEEREAARREMQRRSSGYGSGASGGWGMSFLPYIL